MSCNWTLVLTCSLRLTSRSGLLLKLKWHCISHLFIVFPVLVLPTSVEKQGEPGQKLSRVDGASSKTDFSHQEKSYQSMLHYITTRV